MDLINSEGLKYKCAFTSCKYIFIVIHNLFKSHCIQGPFNSMSKWWYRKLVSCKSIQFFLKHKEVGNYCSQASLKFSLTFLSLLHIHVVTKPQNEDLGKYYLAACANPRMITNTEPGWNVERHVSVELSSHSTSGGIKRYPVESSEKNVPRMVDLIKHILWIGKVFYTSGTLGGF